MFDLKEHLREITEAHAPSGHEGPVRELIRDAWADFVDDFEVDGLGSLIGIKRATRPVDPPRKIMLAAHMDEIGMMVRDIVDGFIFVHRISGADNRLMMAQPVIVHGKEPLSGIVATVPPHLLSAADRKKYPSFDQLVIDVGLPADEVADLVQIGDLITPDAKLIDLNGHLVAGKALDDRSCVAIVSYALNELQSLQHTWDVYATATVQEESGLLGAGTAAFHIQPDIAIALDVGFAPQSGVPSEGTSEIDKGPEISLGANIHPKLYDKLIEVAERHEISYQPSPVVGATGTDAWAIQVAREGIPTALLSLPIRNMHSPVETASLKDMERTGRLLAHFIAALDADFMKAIDWNELDNA